MYTMQILIFKKDTIYNSRKHYLPSDKFGKRYASFLKEKIN